MTHFLILPEEPEPVPITNMFDADGNDVETFEACDMFVAGPLANGTWLSAPAEEFRLALLN